MTLKYDDAPFLDTSFFLEEGGAPQVDLIPLYNVSGQVILELGETGRRHPVPAPMVAAKEAGWFGSLNEVSESWLQMGKVFVAVGGSKFVFWTGLIAEALDRDVIATDASPLTGAARMAREAVQ